MLKDSTEYKRSGLNPWDAVIPLINYSPNLTIMPLNILHIRLFYAIIFIHITANDPKKIYVTNAQMTSKIQRRKCTISGSYLPELAAPIVPDGGSPLLGMLPPRPYLWAGPTGAVSAPAVASRRVLTLSLDAISASASLATPKFPDI